MRKLIFIIAILISVQIQAQKKWTLEECVDYALENNISIKQSMLDEELAVISRKDAFGNYLPSLNANASNAWNTGLTQDVTTGTLKTQTSRNSSYSATLGVSLSQGLTNLRTIQRAELNKLAAQYGLSKMRDDISLFVANSYLQVLLNKENLKSISLQNEVTMEQIDRTKDLVDAGVLPQGDLLEIEATNTAEKQRMVVAENAVRISLISLAQLLLIKEYENFDVEDLEIGLIDQNIISKDINEILANAQQNRSEVKIAEQQLAIAYKNVQIAKGAYYPSLTGFFNYNTRESDFARAEPIVNPDNPSEIRPIGYVESTNERVLAEFPNLISVEVQPDPFMDQLYQNDGISYGFQLRVPVFNGMSARNNVKRNQINLLRQEYVLEQAKLDLESNVYQAYVDAKGALKAYEAATSALKSQELAYEYAKERYDVGLTNAFDFSQSKQRFDTANIEENRAKYDFLFKLKVLELYFGMPISNLN